MLHYWFFLAGVVPIVWCWSPIDLSLSRVMEARGRKETAVLTWGYDRENQEIIIEVQVPRASWIGLGLNSVESLNGSDFVLGGWNEDKETFFYDGHIEGEWPPLEDKSQDYDLIELKDNGTHSFLRVWRKFFTCDPHDQEIENDTLRVIAVFGEDYDLQYSEERSFFKSIYFMEIIPIYHLPSKILTFDIKMNDFPIPDQDTTYVCKFIPLPTLSKKHHILMYEPLIDPKSTEIVHHILIYACPNSTIIPSDIGDCYSGDNRFNQCMDVMFGWAVGGEALYLPDNAGIPIGSPYDPLYVRLEIHYSNFDGITGLKDNSGIRVHYSPKLREHDFGTLMVGMFTFPIQFIPPGAQDFKNYGLCNTEMFPEVLDDPVEDLNVTAFLLHGHLTTRGIRIMHYRNGTLIGSLGEDKKYDFRLQQIRYLPETTTLKVGDQVVVECTGNTMDRDGVTFGGPSTMNEMCLGFLFYYPITQIAACWSFIDLLHVTDALELEHAESIMEAVINMNSVDWDDETREVAQRALMEANYTAIVQNRKETRVNQTSLLPPISSPAPHPCDADPLP